MAEFYQEQRRIRASAGNALDGVLQPAARGHRCRPDAGRTFMCSRSVPAPPLRCTHSSPRIRAHEPSCWSCHQPRSAPQHACGSSSLRAVAGNALQLPFRDRSLDAVVAFEVIEHLPDVAVALEEMLRVLRRPGHIIIGLPNHASLWTPLEDRLRGRDRRAFGVERGRGAWRWWKRNAGLTWRKRLSQHEEFLYREPVLHATAGGDADAVYYAAPDRPDAGVSPSRRDAGHEQRATAPRLDLAGFSQSSCRVPRSWRGV